MIQNTHKVSVVLGISLGKLIIPGPLQVTVSPSSKCRPQVQPFGQAFAYAQRNPKATKQWMKFIVLLSINGPVGMLNCRKANTNVKWLEAYVYKRIENKEILYMQIWKIHIYVNFKPLITRAHALLFGRLWNFDETDRSLLQKVSRIFWTLPEQQTVLQRIQSMEIIML